MRGRLSLLLIVVVAGAAALAWRFFAPSTATAPQTTATLAAAPSAPSDASASAAPSDAGGASPSASDLASPADALASPSATDATALATAAASDAASPAASASDTPSPAPTQTIPAEPTGLAAGWDLQSERTVGGPEADLLVRTGDINNLGYGWPAHFTPFSGESTPPHPYPCEPRPGAAPGTDRIMVGTGVTAQDFKTRNGDGYSGCSARPDNLPQPISIAVGALPASFHDVLVQMFLDDFQAPVWHSHFQVTLNGTRIPTFEDTINAMDQTGPIGKLVTLKLLPEYFPLLRSGTLSLSIDDPTTGAPDGYAVDFVRILVTPHKFKYAVSVACTVVDAETQKPIANASVGAADVAATTGSAGTAELRGVPAGLVSAHADAVGYDGAVQLVDLAAGMHGTATFALHRHRESIGDLKELIKKNGSVALYGIHFDTASAKLRPDSLASLETLLRLIQSDRTSRWLIAGHTDNQGGAAYNLGLSDDRAHSVVAWLVAHGVASDRLSAKGFGLTRPVADNATESGRALNRRVEVSFARS